jgi:hypothetical protein
MERVQLINFVQTDLAKHQCVVEHWEKDLWPDSEDLLLEDWLLKNRPYGYCFCVKLGDDRYERAIIYLCMAPFFSENATSPVENASIFYFSMLGKASPNSPGVIELQDWWNETKPVGSDFEITSTDEKGVLAFTSDSYPIRNLTEDKIKQLFTNMINYLPKVVQKKEEIFSPKP